MKNRGTLSACSRKHLNTILLSIFVLLILEVVPAMAQEKSRRPLTVEDLFQIQEVARSNPYTGTRAVVFSPNGRKLAYVLLHPKNAPETNFGLRLAGNNRGEIWMMSVPNGEPHKITGKNSSADGYWAPVWAPDGQHLAMFSTSGNNIHVSVWNRSIGEIIQLTERGTNPRQGAPIWLSDNELLFTVMAPGKQPFAIAQSSKAPITAFEGYRKMTSGDEVTASILKSGFSEDFEDRPDGKLILYNVRTGKQTVIFNGNVRGLTPSPNKKLIAGFVPVEKYQPKAGQRLPMLRATRYQIRVFNHEEMLSPGKLTSIEYAFPRSLRWAPDGSKFAFVGGAYDFTKDTPLHIYTFSPKTGTLTQLDLGELTLAMPPVPYLPPEFRWSKNNQLIIYAKKQEKKRANWWLVNPSSSVELRNLTGLLKRAPRKIYRIAGTSAWAGVSGGEVWRLPSDGSEPVNLTVELKKRVVAFAWLNKELAAVEGISEVVLQTMAGRGKTELYWLDIESGQIEHMEQPSSEAEMVGFSADRNIAAFSGDDRTGTYFWIKSLDSNESRLVFKTNTFLRNIAKGETKLITYRGLDGKQLKAWILLPINYEKGKRYPLVTYVYPGAVVRGGSMSNATLNWSHPLNLQLLASHGYAVLVPSMPLVPPRGHTGNPYMELMDGVLPAVNKAIQLGIADPNALAVMGQSYGGYGTYGLITQTDRFDAAIALDGPTNLVSSYGTFDARFRYSEFAREGFGSFMMTWHERGQGRMGKPPWKEMFRYALNSPITYAEQVDTPLLIIHGSMDFIPIQQAEEFYTALYRQGKPAKFVRYWGEGHVLSSPANIKHMWQQIFGWLDRYLKPETEEKKKNPN